MITKRIGLLPTSEVAMPEALQKFFAFLDLKVKHKGKTYGFVCDRVKVRPVAVDHDMKKDWDLFVDRTTHWHPFIRAYVQHAMYDGVYVLNHTTTFNAINKHASYVMLERLGARIPKTLIVPPAQYVDDEDYYIKKLQINPKVTEEKFRDAVKSFYHYRDVRLPEMFRNHNEHFDFEGIPDEVGGYPFYLKPAQDGGGGSSVSRIKNPAEFHEKYAESESRVMHAQQAIDFDHFIRCMGIGPQIHPMRFQPDEPIHRHYAEEAVEIAKPELDRIVGEIKIVNAIFRWEYNSYEALVKNGEVWPIDFANACPDSAIASLHVHWPWVIKALVRWIVFCTATDRPMAIDLNQREFLDAAAAHENDGDRFAAVVKLARNYFQEDEFREFAAKHFANLDEAFADFHAKGHLDDILIHEFRNSRFPLEEQETLIEEYREKLARSVREGRNLAY